MTVKASHLKLIEEETQALLDWAVSVEQSDDTYFGKAQTLARRLGAHYRADGLTAFGFWTPELLAEVLRPREIYLEVFTPVDEVDLRSPEQTVVFRRDRLRLRQQGEYFWGVVGGLRAGRRDRLGSLYWMRFEDPHSNLQIIRDSLAESLPFGVFAPAEVYDWETLQAQRADLDYFRQTGQAIAEGPENSELPRVPAPLNILQLHVGTASPEGTFEGLTEIFRRISEKLAAGETLTPAEENYVGYDAVQLLPVEPTIEYRDDNSPESEFFAQLPVDDDSDQVEVRLRKPITQDWGYDVPILGSAATNPALLGSLRPDEAIEFISTLHTFSTGPIQLIYDLVYGHADNQAEQLINRQFLKGPNMYGQDLNHQLPTVRAILLEMQRRKINTGADGIRVDGGQDFRFFNPLSGRIEYDDAYLLAMSDVVQEIGGYQRLMFTIFEDGRPWPQEGWEETSTYRELTELRPEAYQWGPLIFAHNTPTLEKFWDQKWRRVCEVMYQGDRWITGCANHDTVRRGNQVDPQGPVNRNLGETLPEVLDNAYDNPAVTLWVYGFSPGLPMDFLNALMRSPWLFFRNTDERYGVKVVSEEVGFLDWQVTPELYDHADLFPRLKSLGFETLGPLREFAKALQTTMVETDCNLNAVVEACQTCLDSDSAACGVSALKSLRQSQQVPFAEQLDIPKLKAFALMFMEDCYEACNVSRDEAHLSPEQTAFNRSLREFRRSRPWLRENLSGGDRFNRISEEKQSLFYGWRANPEQPEEQVVMAAHMGGEPLTVTLGDWLQLDLSEWKVAIASPGLQESGAIDDLRLFELKDSQAVLLVRA